MDIEKHNPLLRQLAKRYYGAQITSDQYRDERQKILKKIEAHFGLAKSGSVSADVNTQLNDTTLFLKKILNWVQSPQLGQSSVLVFRSRKISLLFVFGLCMSMMLAVVL